MDYQKNMPDVFIPRKTDIGRRWAKHRENAKAMTMGKLLDRLAYSVKSENQLRLLYADALAMELLEREPWRFKRGV